MGSYRYPVDELLRLVEELGDKAVQARTAGVAAQRKPDRTVVTEMDVYIEEKLFEFVRAHFPDDWASTWSRMPNGMCGRRTRTTRSINC